MSVELIKLDPLFLRGKKPDVTFTPGTWICGGAIRQWFVGHEKPSDIDVFGVNPEALEAFRSVNCSRGTLLNSSVNADTYLSDGRTIQLIKRYFPNIPTTLDAFDFTVCQFAWDGGDVYSTANAIISVLRNHLGVHKIAPELAADTLRRAFKYQRKGYIPCAGTIRDLGQAFVGLTKAQIQSQVEFSPNGGTRTVGID